LIGSVFVKDGKVRTLFTFITGERDEKGEEDRGRGGASVSEKEELTIGGRRDI
jgi:hypothetical protein